MRTSEPDRCECSEPLEFESGDRALLEWLARHYQQAPLTSAEQAAFRSRLEARFRARPISRVRAGLGAAAAAAAIGVAALVSTRPAPSASEQFRGGTSLLLEYAGLPETATGEERAPFEYLPSDYEVLTRLLDEP
jgi:hypothetical protein